MRKLLLVLISVFCVVIGWAQTTNIVKWDFTPTSTDYASNTTNQNAARTTDLTSTTLSTIGIAGGATAVAASTFHRTTGWPTSSSSTKYLEFSITLNGGQTFSDNAIGVSLGAQVSSTTTAARDYIVTYGYGSSPTFATATNGSVTGTGTSTTTTTNISIPAPGNTTTSLLTVRILISGSTSTTGNFRIATLALTGFAPIAAACSSADPVSSLSATNGSTQSVVSWTNGTCYDEMMVVASSAAFTAAVPSGNGSAYTASSTSFTNASNTVFDGGVVVYKSSGTNVTVTSLTNGTTYNFKVFTRKGTTWSSGVTTTATPVVSQFFWDADGNTTAATGGTGTWDASTTSNWRSPNSTGTLATWSTNTTPVDAVFAGTAGIVTSAVANTFTAPNFNFNTTGYSLATSSTSTLTLSGNTVLGSNVNLALAPNVNTTTPVSGTMAFGNISGTGTASLTISAAQSATAVAARINLASVGASISVPVTISSAGGTGSLGLAGIVAVSTVTSLSSLATITNNTSIKTIIGATGGNDLTINSSISGSADLQFSAGASGGAGIVTLNAANTYVGATLFNAANSGVVKLGIVNAIPTTSDLTLGYSTSNGGILDLNGFNQTIGSLTSGAGGGSIRNNGASDVTLTISGSGVPAAFALPITDGTTNKILVTRAGTGTTELTGACTYTGATAVTGGTLKLNKSGGSTIPATNNATVSGTGTLQISSNQTLANLTISAGGTLIIDNGVTLSISGTLINNGTVTNNGNITLLSTVTATASIGNSAGSIGGNVTAQKYIPGGGLSTATPSTRAYRFVAHPFSSAIALSQLQTAIDITGTGTGFDASGSNSPSAFTWNQANATGGINDGGWSAFATTAATNWNRYKAIRLFYRGTKGTGLNGVTYTVGSATLSMTGTVNIGDQVIPLSYPNTGTTSNFNFIGNPYPSNVDMTAVTKTNTTSSYYVWNLGLGNRGGYSTVSFGAAYVLPAYAGFFAEANAASPSITFHESDKTTSASTNTLLRTNNANSIDFQLKSGIILWDELKIASGKNYTEAKEYDDAKKLRNPDVSLYTLSSDNIELAIDKRNIKAGDIIPMGLSTNGARSFTLEVSNLAITGIELYLHDKYLDVTQKIETGSVYSFSTDANAASQGNNRFELIAKQGALLPTIIATSFSVKLSPNPAKDFVKVTFTNEEKTSTVIVLTNAEGKTIKTVDAGNVQNGQANINVKGLARGTYYVTLNNGKENKTEKLQVQ